MKRLNRIASILLIAAFALMFVALLGGCNQSIPADWVAADRARLESVGAEYRGYYSADGSLTLEERQRRDRTMELWQKDVESHEAAIQAGGGQ